MNLTQLITAMDIAKERIWPLKKTIMFVEEDAHQKFKDMFPMELASDRESMVDKYALWAVFGMRVQLYNWNLMSKEAVWNFWLSEWYDQVFIYTWEWLAVFIK